MIPAHQNLRYWINADSLQPKILNIDDNKSYFWEAKNQIKLSSEVYNDDIEDVAGIVKIAPKNFEIEDYKGNMTSWKNFGLWYYDLYKNRLTLSPEARKEIRSKVNPNENLKNKVIKLYKYMQSKTRYVNITLGIGGWQPLPASYVYNHGYGDCKALSNFMVSILKTANIKAYPVLINHGHEGIPFINKFPSNQFNHVIVCVPFKKDTMWLECTSQTTQAGFLGSGSENRGALMITPNGGVVVNTPKSIAEKNIQRKIIEVSLENGNAYAKADIKWIGDQQDYVRNVILEESPKGKEIWIKKLFEVPDIKVNSSVFNEDEEGVNLKGDFGLYKYASLSGKRIFFNPNLMERRSYVPAILTEKLSPQRFYYPYIDIDSATYTIPQNYKVESLPNEVKLKSSFGSFLEKTVSDSSGKVCFLRRLEVDTYEIPAKNYDEYQKFFSKVVKADRSKVVLIKNEK